MTKKLQALSSDEASIIAACGFHYQSCCGIYAPPVNAKIKVHRKLDTGHRYSGRGLYQVVDENGYHWNCIPEGEYIVGPMTEDRSSHWITLERPGNSNLHLCVGYGLKTEPKMVDWTHITIEEGDISS